MKLTIHSWEGHMPSERKPNLDGPINRNVEKVDATSPLRLKVAARLAFPDGSMTVSGLRREIAKGRLAYEMIAGKQYTTLADIVRMRELCRRPIDEQARHSATSLGAELRAEM